MERLPGLLARKLPVDLCPLAVGLAVPDPRFPLQCAQIWYAPLAEALPGIQAQFDLRLIQPASVFRGVVHRKPVPKVSALLLAKGVDQRLSAVDIEVIHDEVDGPRGGVLIHDVVHHMGKLSGAAVGSGGGEVPARLRLHRAKHVGRAAPFVLVIRPRRFSWSGRPGRAHIGVQRHGLLVQANDRLGRLVWLLIDRQYVLHSLDVVPVQFRHAPHFFPATASSRGFRAAPGLSLGPRGELTCA